MKRFYKEVTFIEQEGSYLVQLDGRQIKTPEKSLCLIPTMKMAEAVAKEWDDQKDDVEPHQMPITKLMNTAIDRVGKRREELIEELVEFAGSDQLCYRADNPEALVLLQKKVWDPHLKLLHDNHGVSFKLTNSIVFVEQDVKSLLKIRKIIEKIEDFKLTAFYGMTTVTGSISIGINLFEGHVSVDEAWAAGHLDENFQVSQWGEDDEAAERRNNLKNELKNAAYFLSLCEK